MRGALILATLLALMSFGCADDDADDDSAPADDDAGDDDASAPPASPWDGLAPRGLPVGRVLGMATQMDDRPGDRWERDFEIEKLVEAGMLRIRASIDWGDVEPARGDWRLDSRDFFVAMLTEAGLQFDGRVCYGVDWARPDGDDSAMDPADFAGYAGAVAGHYCGVINSFEVWNEENLSRFWKPEPDPERFGALMKATYRAVKEACPTTQVVFGGLSVFDGDTPWLGFWSFLDRVHRAHPDIGDSFDVLAIHPYTFLQQTEPEWSGSIGGDVAWPDLPGLIDAARQRLAAMNLEWMPIWVTEFGWPSLLVGDEAQGRYLARGSLVAIAAGVEALDWYTFWDKDGTSSLPTEDYFGLFTYPNGPGGPREKPAFRKARGLTRVLGLSRFAGDLAEPLGLPEGVYGLAFVEDGTGAVTFAGWDARPGSETEIALPCPAGTVAYQGYTDEGEPAFAGGAVEYLPLRLSGAVQYVRFEVGR